MVSLLPKLLVLSYLPTASVDACDVSAKETVGFLECDFLRPSNARRTKHWEDCPVVLLLRAVSIYHS